MLLSCAVLFISHQISRIYKNSPNFRYRFNKIFITSPLSYLGRGLFAQNLRSKSALHTAKGKRLLEAAEKLRTKSALQIAKHQNTARSRHSTCARMPPCGEAPHQIRSTNCKTSKYCSKQYKRIFFISSFLSLNLMIVGDGVLDIPRRTSV